jgi:hypothetical protein
MISCNRRAASGSVVSCSIIWRRMLSREPSPPLVVDQTREREADITDNQAGPRFQRELPRYASDRVGQISSWAFASAFYLFLSSHNLSVWLIHDAETLKVVPALRRIGLPQKKDEPYPSRDGSQRLAQSRRRFWPSYRVANPKANQPCGALGGRQVGTLPGGVGP